MDERTLPVMGAALATAKGTSGGGSAGEAKKATTSTELGPTEWDLSGKGYPCRRVRDVPAPAAIRRVSQESERTGGTHLWRLQRGYIARGEKSDLARGADELGPAERRTCQERESK